MPVVRSRKSLPRSKSRKSRKHSISLTRMVEQGRRCPRYLQLSSDLQGNRRHTKKFDSDEDFPAGFKIMVEVPRTPPRFRLHRFQRAQSCNACTWFRAQERGDTVTRGCHVVVVSVANRLSCLVVSASLPLLALVRP